MLNITTFLVKPKVEKPAGWSVYADYMAGKKPLVWYRFSEKSGTTVINHGENGGNGTYEGSIALVQPGLVSGDSDKAVLLGDGSSADPYFDNVELLIRADKGIIDVSNNNRSLILSGTTGTPTLSTNYAKFGTESIEFIGTDNQIIRTPTDSGFAFLGDDFTMEVWYLPVDKETYSAIISADGSDYPWMVYHGSNVNSGNPIAQFGSTSGWGSASLNFNSVPNLNWVHLAVTRKNGVFRIFQNGTLIQTDSSWLGDIGTPTGFFTMCQNGTAGNGNLGCYVDSLRITKNVCRYDSDFPVPAGPFPMSPSLSQVNLGDITKFANAGTLGYDVRLAFKPTNNYDGGTANEILHDMHYGTNGMLIEYETGNLKYTHGSETVSIAATFVADSTNRLCTPYNSATKTVSVYNNGALLDSYTFTNALVMPEVSKAVREFYSFAEDFKEANIGTDPTKVGTPIISSDQYKYYGKSLRLDSSLTPALSDYLTIPVTPLGTNDFTVRCWFRADSVSTSQAIVSLNSNYVIYTASNKLFVFNGSTNILQASISSATWHHFDFERAGDLALLYVDGVFVGTRTGFLTVNFTQNFVYLGHRVASLVDFTGYIQDFNVIAGTALHSDQQSFAPPSALLVEPVFTLRGNCTIDEFIFDEGPATAEDIAKDASYFKA